jgi:hypothetical protein
MLEKLTETDGKITKKFSASQEENVWGKQYNLLKN